MMAVSVDYPQPFTPCWKNLLTKIEKQGKNIMKMDDLLIFVMLEKLCKTHTNVANSGGCLRRMKKLNAVYRLNWENFQLLCFILNIQVQLP